MKFTVEVKPVTIESKGTGVDSIIETTKIEGGSISVEFDATELKEGLGGIRELATTIATEIRRDMEQMHKFRMEQRADTDRQMDKLAEVIGLAAAIREQKEKAGVQ